MTTIEKIIYGDLLFNVVLIAWFTLRYFFDKSEPINEGTIIDCPNCGRATKMANVKDFGCCSSCMENIAGYP